MAAKMTARDIRDLLETKHSKDLVVHEAPIGPGGSGQIDTWVLRRSWTRASTIGYEIKVTRSDFVGDQKWMAYLPACNEFYFAVAPGVCDPREIPEGVGLMVASSTGTRLYTKIKAPRRVDGVEAIEDVMRSLLINRADIRESRFSGRVQTRDERIACWRRRCDEGRIVGHLVARAIQERWDELEMKAIRAQREVARLDEFKRVLSQHGFDPEASRWVFQNNIKARLGTEIDNVLNRALQDLTELRSRLPKGDGDDKKSD